MCQGVHLLLSSNMPLQAEHCRSVYISTLVGARPLPGSTCPVAAQGYLTSDRR